MLQRFRDFIAANDLCDPTDRILLAVSGGLDSMAALDLFLEAGYSVGVAHCNFQLRGADAMGDEAFVKEVCDHKGLKFFVNRFDTKNYAEASGISIQMAARDLRYAWFGKLVEDEKYHWLATAHHLNDNIETVLLRWVSGASLDQLRGIAVKNDKIIRPLLFATRQEIEAYARERKIIWREDASNASDDYHRNFIRHQVIPKLKEINPSLEKTFESSLRKLKGAHEMMTRGVGQARDGMTRMEGEKLYIDKTLLSLLENPAFICHECLRPYGFDWEKCESIAGALVSQAGTQFLSPTHMAVIDRDYIIVSPQLEAMSEILIEEGQDKATLGPWKLVLTKSAGRDFDANPASGTFDGAKIKFPVLWRKWKAGDSFYPLGMSRPKKISDFLIDQKVSLPDKNATTVLVSAGEIIWVAGHRIDERVKVTPSTATVLRVRLSHI